MGFYLRKSISVGPFRFNISNHGIGQSVGIKGLRIGAGPRGNYIHAGRGGFYYRKNLSPITDKTAIYKKPANHQQSDLIPPGFTEIDSGDVSAMTDSSSDELLAEINQKRKRKAIWPLIAWIGGLISFVAIVNFGFIGLIAVVATIGAATYQRLRDAAKHTTVIFYDEEDESMQGYKNLHQAFMDVSRARKVWHVPATADIIDKKYHGGASQKIIRNPISICTGQPPRCQINFDPVLIPVGKQTLCFLPDRILFFAKDGVGAISYKDLIIQSEPVRFIETESVPSDAERVGTTWKYVNKKGDADKRFKDNRQLPIVQYDALSLKSKNGLNEMLYISLAGAGNRIAEKLKNDINTHQ